MKSVVVRKSGGASIVSIPKHMLDALGLKDGSTLNASLKNGGILLTPKTKPLTLEALLAGSTNEDFGLTIEDQVWEGARPIGKEI